MMLISLSLFFGLFTESRKEEKNALIKFIFSIFQANRQGLFTSGTYRMNQAKLKLYNWVFHSDG